MLRSGTRHTGDVAPRSDRMTFLFDFFVANARLRSLLGQTMSEAGLRADEYAVYSAVAKDGPVSITALARTLGMPLATTSDYVRTMTSRGHARRYRNPDDSRSFLVVPTDAGRAAHRTARISFGDTMRRLRAALDLPEEDLVRALDALTAAIRTVQEDLAEEERHRSRTRPPLPG